MSLGYRSRVAATQDKGSTMRTSRAYKSFVQTARVFFEVIYRSCVEMGY